MKFIRAIVAISLAVVGFSPAVVADARDPSIRSSSEFLSPDLKAEQSDDLRNRGMLWVEQGAELWQQPAGASGTSCRSCHGSAETSMRGVVARLPAVEAATGRLMNIERRINACRGERQHALPLAYESDELLALTSYIGHQSRGLPMSVRTDGAAAAYFEAGRDLWQERQGQLNLACSQCHDASVGRKLRGDTISSGIGTGYPAYRLEWQGLGSLHRRLRACQLGVRAHQFEQGASEYLALELYIAWRARGQPIEVPALRR